MEEIKTDLLIIGSGPSGQKAAIQASKLGKSVVIVDKLPSPGGNCLYNGTIPSKSLREAIIDLTRFNERQFYGAEFHPHDVSIAELQKRLSKVIDEERVLIERQLNKNNSRVNTAHEFICQYRIADKCTVS